MEFIDRHKKQLPLALVLRDERGQVRVLEIAPAREGKLGAYLREPDEARRREILKRIGEK